MAARGGAFGRLYRGETSFDFAGRWRRWFVISGAVILIGLVSVGVRGLDFSIQFKGGTTWTVPTTASVAQTRSAIDKVGPALSAAQVQVLTDRETGQRTVEVSAPAKATTDLAEVRAVSAALAHMAHVNSNLVGVNAIGPSWGSNITSKAIKAVIIFLVVVAAYIWLRFEGKMAIAALTALVHDILVTVGIYSLSGFQVSPDTVIAFLTILGYSLYDTIVVFDKVQENTRGVASSNRLTYTETVNLSMNEVLARSLNTSFVAIIPILSILVIGAGLLGATSLNDFGLALFIGLTTGAYSSIFIASPLLALLKEREPRYAAIRQRRGNQGVRHLTPAEAARGRSAGPVPSRAGGRAPEPAAPAPPSAATATLQREGERPAPPVAAPPSRPVRTPRRRAASSPLAGGGSNGASSDQASANGSANGNGAPGPVEPDAGGSAPRPSGPVPPRPGTKPPPRPRKKKGRR